MSDRFSQEWLPRIDQELNRSVSQCQDCPETLLEAMRYTLLAPGKRIRPLLALMAADACGGNPKKALPAACAVEMVHAFSLIHDDLPAMDDDDVRRGKPSSHKVYGEGRALLAGDALLVLAFETLSSIEPAETAVACYTVLSQAVGPAGMTGGQWDDISGGVATLQALESLQRRKTGALIEAALAMGAAVAEAPSEQRIDLKEYGWRIGLAFQITDDLLDSDDHSPSFVALLGVRKSKERAQELVEQAIHQLSSFGERAACLRSLAQNVLHRTQ